MNIHDNKERLIYCTSTHWMKYAQSAIKNHFLALLGIILLFVSNIALLEAVSMATFGVACLLIIYAHHSFFHKIMSESMYDIFLTSTRIIYFDDSLFLINDEHEIPLHRIAGIEVNQNGIIQNILNYGTLWIDTGGGTIDFKQSIPLVPNPEGVNENITQAIQEFVKLPQ